MHATYMQYTKRNINTFHYSDVTMSAMASQITATWTVSRSSVQAHIKENIKALRHWPLLGEFTGDR